MSRSWMTRTKFQVGRTKRSIRRAQVEVGPQEFPPPSEEEVQELVEQIEEATRNIDEVIGFDATLKARFGQPFVDYLKKLSDGLHYALLEGRRPGPPPGFESGEPDVEIEGEEPALGLPGLEEEEEAPLPGLPRPAATRQPIRQTLAKLSDTALDLDRLIADSVEDITILLRSAGKDTEAAYKLNDAADMVRESLAEVEGALNGQDG